jgi:hypothetical protein
LRVQVAKSKVELSTAIEEKEQAKFDMFQKKLALQ